MSAKTTEKTSAKACFKSERRRHDALTVIFSILSFIYLIPIFLVAMNSFKSNASINLETFAVPAARAPLSALDQLYQGPYLRQLSFPEERRLFAADHHCFRSADPAVHQHGGVYIARVGSGFSKLVYYLCVFLMVVPS